MLVREVRQVLRALFFNPKTEVPYCKITGANSYYFVQRALEEIHLYLGDRELDRLAMAVRLLIMALVVRGYNG